MDAPCPKNLNSCPLVLVRCGVFVSLFLLSNPGDILQPRSSVWGYTPTLFKNYFVTAVRQLGLGQASSLSRPVQFRPRSPSNQPRPSTSIRTLIDHSLPPSNPHNLLRDRQFSICGASSQARNFGASPDAPCLRRSCTSFSSSVPVPSRPVPRYRPQIIYHPTTRRLVPATLLLREIPRSGRILRDQPSIDPASREARSRHSPVRPFGSLSLSSAATITCIRPTSRPRPPPDSSPRTRMPLAHRPQLVGLSIRP